MTEVTEQTELTQHTELTEQTELIEQTQAAPVMAPPDVDEATLRAIAELGDEDLDPELEKTLLQAVTSSNPLLRNLAAIALAKAQCHAAVPTLLALLETPATFGYRSSILEALRRLRARLPVGTLTRLILFDPREVQEDALALLQRAVRRARLQDCSMALQWALDSLTGQPGPGQRSLVFDAIDLLLERIDQRRPLTS